MARKGERFKQQPMLWHIGIGFPCAVMRRRRVRREIKGVERWTYRWERWDHKVLTYASARRWWRLEKAGRAQIRRDVAEETFIGFGILPKPIMQEWAKRQEVSA